MKSINIAKPFAVGERTIKELVVDEPTLKQLDIFYETIEFRKLEGIQLDLAALAVLNGLVEQDEATGRELANIAPLYENLKKSDYARVHKDLLKLWGSAPDEESEKATEGKGSAEGNGLAEE